MTSSVLVWYAARHLGCHIHPEDIGFRHKSKDECIKSLDDHKRMTGYLIDAIIVRVEEKTVRDDDGNFISRNTWETAVGKYPESREID